MREGSAVDKERKENEKIKKNRKGSKQGREEK